MIHRVKGLGNIKSTQIDSVSTFNAIIHNTFHSIDRMRAAAILLETKLIVTGY